MKLSFFASLVLCTASVMNAQVPPLTAAIMRVTLLGTGVPLLDPAAYVASGRVTAGLMVEAGTERLLFDCGQGIVTRLLQAGGGAAAPYISINHIFLSHLHSDHIADLGALYAYGWLFRYDQPFLVWGPSGGPNQPVGTAALMFNFRAAFDTDFYVRCCAFTDPNEIFPLSGVNYAANELWQDVVYSSNGVKVTAFQVDHDPVTPSYGFRIDYQGHSVVFSGDTTYSANLIANSQNVDVLIHEVYGFARSTGPQIFDYHTSPELAATIFNATKPKQAVFTHIAIPPGSTAAALVARTVAAGYTGPLQAGSDLMTILVNASGVTLTPYSASQVEAPATSVPAELAPRTHHTRLNP